MGLPIGYTVPVRFKVSELSEHLDGELVGPDVEIDGVSIDSRAVASGNLFVPIVAERDGHDFIPAAAAAGAAAYLTTELPSAESLVPAASAIVVADTSVALTGIGRLARARMTGPVVGITGSVGKTSVKDLTLAACGGVRRTHASEKSFNNELGVPLTLANAPSDVEVTIVEMGARGIGHIAELCEVGRPSVGVVTTVALAHSELFGSIEGVAAAKGELIEALPSGGVAVLNADNPHVAAMAERTDARVLTFGRSPGADVQVVEIQLDELLRPRFVLATPTGRADVELDARGAHMAVNAAAAVAAALAVGVDLADAVAGLAAVEMSPWRMEVTRTAGGLVVINDAYNANPTSMRAALDALTGLDAVERVAVVGEMAELGVEGPAEHLAITEEARAKGVRVIAVAAEAYGPGAEHATDRTEVKAMLGSLGPGAAVLVKGSRVAALEELAAELIEDGGR